VQRGGLYARLAALQFNDGGLLAEASLTP